MLKSTESVEKALRDSGGNVSAAARKLGVSRRHLHRLIVANEELQDVLDDSRESVADRAEACIAQAITAGDVKTAIWYLMSSQAGRSRGFAKDSSRATDSQASSVRLVEVVCETPEQVRDMMNYEDYAALEKR